MKQLTKYSMNMNQGKWQNIRKTTKKRIKSIFIGNIKYKILTQTAYDIIFI